MPSQWRLMLALLSLLTACVNITALGKENTTIPIPKTLIVDSDLLNFIDDALALGLANVLASRGRVHIAGEIASVRSRYVPSAMDAINTYYNHGDIPIAVEHPIGNMTIDPLYPQYADFLTGLTYNFTNSIQDGGITPEPQRLYRQLLTQSADKSVTIAAIGFHENLRSLLKSSADDISPLTGSQLVERKVTELVVQGNPTGQSFNFHRYDPSAAIFVLTNWPGTVTFVPDAVGDRVWVGKRLTTEMDPVNNPVSYAFATAIGIGIAHQAWDATAMYYAANSLDDMYIYDRSGSIYFLPNGSAAWNDSSTPMLQRTIALREGRNDTLATKIEDALIWDPSSNLWLRGISLARMYPRWFTWR